MKAWRWRRGVEDRYHYRFWGQVVRWMAHKRHLMAGQGMRLVYSPENPIAGDTLFIYATIMDERGMPRGKGRCKADHYIQFGKVEHYDLNPVPGVYRVYTGNIKLPNRERIRSSFLRINQNHDLKRKIMVSAEKLEKLGRPINLTILKEIADLTNLKICIYK